MVNLPELCHEIIEKCNEKSIPVISLGVPVDECYSAVFSNTDCVEFIVDHLIELLDSYDIPKNMIRFVLLNITILKKFFYKKL